MKNLGKKVATVWEGCGHVFLFALRRQVESNTDIDAIFQRLMMEVRNQSSPKRSN